MRIIAGTARGRKIEAPKGDGIIRPAQAKVRESIFSSLGDVEDKVILDVFAGTGSLGLEGLSRGAAWSDFIESHPVAIRCLIKNLQTLGFADQAHVFKRNLPTGLKELRLKKRPDIIFCDPPYDKGLVNSTLQALLKYKFIDPSAIVIVEHSPREYPEINELRIIKQKKYGQTFVSFLHLCGDLRPPQFWTHQYR